MQKNTKKKYKANLLGIMNRNFSIFFCNKFDHQNTKFDRNNLHNFDFLYKCYINEHRISRTFIYAFIHTHINAAMLFT